MFQKRISALTAVAGGVLAPSTAFAFELGRKIRTPDWMDPYFVMLCIATAVFFIAAMIARPRGVSLDDSEIDRMPFVTKFYFSAFLGTQFIMVCMLVIGGVLARQDEHDGRQAADAAQSAAALEQRLAKSIATKDPTLRFLNGDDLYELPAALAEMTHVTNVQLIDSRVKDISVLAQMPQLRRVDISGSKVTDLSPLSGLSNLVEIDFARTRVKDLSPLSRLNRLKVLTASGSHVTDLTPIAGLKELEVLKLTRTDVADISALRGHPSLRLVEIQRTKVKDLRPALTWPAMQPYMAQDPDNGGLRFARSAAAESDPALAAMTKGQPRARLGKLAAYYQIEWPIKVAGAD